MTTDVLSDAPKKTEGDGLRQSMPKVGKWVSVRFGLAYMGCLGSVMLYMQRANLSIAIISMVNSSALIQDSGANVSQIATSKQSMAGEFNWSASQVGLVLSAFFYGYIVTQFPGGYLSTRFGGKLLFGGGVLVTSVLTLVTPLAARTSIYWLVAVRLLEGMAEGVAFPALQTIFGAWAPPLERSLLVSIAFSGMFLGSLASQVFSGLLCDSNFLGGWPSVFYVFGGVGVIWCVVWFALAYDTPDKHPRIAREELEYIQQNTSQQNSKRRPRVPWCAIVSSKAVWAAAVAQFISMWGMHTFVTSLSLYLEEVLHFRIEQNGYISSLPFLATLVMMNLGGYVANRVQEKHLLSATNTRKVWVSIGGFGAGASFLAAGFVNSSSAAAVSFIVVCAGFVGILLSASMPNVVDIAPRYSGLLMGITNTLNGIPGFVIPLIVGALTEKAATRTQWMYVFVLACVVYVSGAVFFLVFGSGEEQAWNKYTGTSFDDEDEESASLLK